MGPTSFTWLHDLHKTMDVSLNKDGVALWTFNPAATESIEYMKPELQQPSPPIPFIILGKLVEQNLHHSREQEKMEISYHRNIVLHIK